LISFKANRFFIKNQIYGGGSDMKKYFLQTLFFVAISSMLISCAPQKTMTTQPKFEPYAFPAGQYTQESDSFMVLLDASGTMNESYKGQTKFHTAREVVSRMNQTIPADLKLSAALRAFGQAFSNDTALRYGLTSYEKVGLEGALKNVSWGGWSPLSRTITATSEDLESTKGNIAVFVVSDGLQTDGGAVSAAKNMKQRYGDRVCIYTILIGNNPTGKDLMEQVARASDCGFSTNGEDILSSEDMGSFVAKTFLGTAADSDGDGVADTMDKCPNTPKGAMVDAKGCALDSDGDGVADHMDKCPDTPKGATVDAKGCPLDSDGDGVADTMDKCPNTPKGVAVDAKGCALDSDGDGVADDMDKCPNTPKGATVDAKGCPLDSDGDGVYDYLDKCPNTPKGAPVDARGCWVLKGVKFDTAKWDIKPEGYGVINEAVDTLKTNPSLKLEVQGHTDNRGAAGYNQDLSEKRAKAVMNYMLEKGIANARLTFVGYGFSKPATSNATAEGRALNRRVELKPLP
jgi:OOP family OmpA-OmpF porin